MKFQANHNCPITKVINLLSDKWTMHIMYALAEGPLRFSELERSLEGISSRTLTLKLKELLDKKLVKKDVQGKYKRTRRGAGLKIIEQAMGEYHRTCLKKIN